MRVNTTRLCYAYISQECIHLRGADTCVVELLTEQAQQRQQQQHGARTALLTAVLVPVLVVGASSVLPGWLLCHVDCSACRGLLRAGMKNRGHQPQ